MALIRNPHTGQIFDLPQTLVHDLRAGFNQHGGEWLHRHLLRYQPVAERRANEILQAQPVGRPVDNDPTHVNWVGEPEVRGGRIHIEGEDVFGFGDADPTPDTRKRLKKEVSELLPPLTLPVIPEAHPDGTKKLFKTRYSELEKLHIALHAKYQQQVRERMKLREEYDMLVRASSKQGLELQEAKRLSLEGAKLDKLLARVCKETQTAMPQNPFGAQTLEQKLEAFLGAILCRVRTEAIQDELAD